MDIDADWVRLTTLPPPITTKSTLVSARVGRRRSDLRFPRAPRMVWMVRMVVRMAPTEALRTKPKPRSSRSSTSASLGVLLSGSFSYRSRPIRPLGSARKSGVGGNASVDVGGAVNTSHIGGGKPPVAPGRFDKAHAAAFARMESIAAGTSGGGLKRKASAGDGGLGGKRARVESGAAQTNDSVNAIGNNANPNATTITNTNANTSTDNTE
ncbi:hypothetical protein C8J57DRAFT_207280 [Mycena rebaudengoi]|nr:hypothetical protein C8J57DRAFT_207280 [Mycena rebaudengoi]